MSAARVAFSVPMLCRLRRQSGYRCMSIFTKLLVHTGVLERRKNRRVSLRGLEASYGAASAPKKARIRDISPTGIYIVTKDRWPPGTNIALTIERKGFLDRQSRRHVRLRARCVRFGEDGVGLTFSQDDTDSDRWLKAMDRAATLVRPDDVIQLFRIAKSLAFLSRVSPSFEDGALESMIGFMIDVRLDRSMEITHRAEELLERWGSAFRTDVPPAVILRVLDDASKAENDEAKRLWAWLLATACSEGYDDDESLRFANILSNLLPGQLGIFQAAGKKAVQTGWEPGSIFSEHIYCTAEEIRKVARIRNLVAIERDLNHLHELGLLEKPERALGCAQLERANLTPTSRGLKLYIRCSLQSEHRQRDDGTECPIGKAEHQAGIDRPE